MSMEFPFATKSLSLTINGLGSYSGPTCIHHSTSLATVPFGVNCL